MIATTPVQLRDLILLFTTYSKPCNSQSAVSRTGQRWRATRAAGSSEVRLLHRGLTGPCPGESVNPTFLPSHFGVMR